MLYANDPRRSAALWLMAIAGVCLLALTGVVIAVLLSVMRTTQSIADDVHQTRTELIAQVSRVLDGKLDGRVFEDRLPLRALVLREVDKQASGIRRDATDQLSAISDQADAQISGARADLRASVDQITLKLEGIANAADGQLTGLRAQIGPVLDQISPVLVNAAALTKDAQDSWDDSYDDVRGLVESTTYAATQTAQTMETVRAAAPEFIATGQESNRQVAGVVTDLHKLTTTITAPVSLRMKIWNAFRGVALVASHF